MPGSVDTALHVHGRGWVVTTCLLQTAQDAPDSSPLLRPQAEFRMQGLHPVGSGSSTLRLNWEHWSHKA